MGVTKRDFLAAPVVLVTCMMACSSSGGGGPSGGSPAGQGGSDSSAGGSSNTTAGGDPSGGSGTDNTGGSGAGDLPMDTDAGIDMPHGPPPDFGPNVLIFDPTMPMATIQAQIDANKQATTQFGTSRYAYFFKPVQYALDVKVVYYMQVLGLGQSPDDVVITGAVRSKADLGSGNATLNFWRSAENLAIVPTQDGKVNVWAISQGTSFRRVHVKGPLALSDGGFSSGGFVADSLIDGQVSSGSQQQFFTRNTDWASWSGGVW